MLGFIGFIGRLDYQKGLDLIQSALPELMQEDVQLVMLGSGDPTIESWMKMSESTYKDRFRGWVGFSVPVSHKITAECDTLLMPSRFEPCGLIVILWDLRTEKIARILETNSPVTSAEVSQDGRYITTADGNSVKFWDANHFGMVKSYTMSCMVESASLEPTMGNKFVAGREDMWVRLFDFHTGKEIACNKGHHGPVHCVRFAPGGESYSSGSEDGTIRIWQTLNMNPEENDNYGVNGLSSKVRVGVDDVVQKVEGFHISSDGHLNEKPEKPNA